MSRNTNAPKWVEDLVIERDKSCCARCGVRNSGVRGEFGWAIHHRQARGMGGSKSDPCVNLPANLIVVCFTCHDWIENHRTLSYAEGWLVSRLRLPRPNEVPIHHFIHGRVVLDNFGGFSALVQG